jgi:hypothetical protein
MIKIMTMLILRVLLAILMLFIVSCKGHSSKNEKMEHEPIACVIAIDGTRSYKYIDKAKQTTARIVQNLPGNSKVYVRWITKDSLSDKCSVVTALFPNTSKPHNPFDVKAKQRYHTALIKFQQTSKQATKAIIDSQSPRAGQTDIYGALYASSVRFSGNTDMKRVLILLTDMDDNVGNKDKLNINLENVTVKIMDFQAGPEDDKRKEQWLAYLTSRGAASVQFLPIDEPLNMEGI